MELEEDAYDGAELDVVELDDAMPADVVAGEGSSRGTFQQ